MLTRKTQRQLIPTSSPPTTGPRAAIRPPIAVHARTLLSRSSPELVASTMLSDVGVISAAPAAWTTRKTTNASVSFAAAQSADATVNTATPSRNPYSRGKRSARRPKTTSRAA